MKRAVSASAATQPAKQRQRSSKPQPRYQVVLWDDNDHTYEYVIEMMRSVFGLPPIRGFQVARSVDTTGRAICLVTTREHAELKQQQVHAFGKDRRILHCAGSMTATIEPVS